MSSRKKQLLYFTNSDSGRDVEIMLPLLHFAKRFLNCQVEVTLTPNLHAMFRRRPDCVVVANTVGAFLHFHIARAAHASGIPVFSLVSEGNFRTDGSFDYWGYNTAHILYERYHCCWSRRTRDFMRAELPELRDRIVQTGGVGFDRYKIYDFAERESLLRRHGYHASGFKRFIGYAGWGFGKLAHERGRKELLQYFRGDASKLLWAEKQRLALEEILRQAIEAHPDTLFILKKHPTENVSSEPDPHHNEMAALRDYKNVLYLLDQHVHDLINITDLWWVYESTTSLEADIMGKQTLFIVPDDNFPRVEIHEGFPEAKTFREVSNMTEHFFTCGTLPGFDNPQLVRRRAEIIENSIGFADGYNHIRAAYYLQKTLEEPPPQPGPANKAGFSLYYCLAYWVLRVLMPAYHIGLFSRLPWLRKKLWVFEKYKLSGLPELEARYARYLDRFYADEKIDERLEADTLFEEILLPQH